MTALRALVGRYLETFNAGDLDAWSALFADDVSVAADMGTGHGREAVRSYAERTFRVFPGIQARLTRIVAEDGPTIVVEYRFVNPEPDRHDWRLEGSVCDVYEVADGRIAVYRGHYLPDPRDRSGTVTLPSRIEGARVTKERAALRRVAGLVGQRVSQEQLFRAVDEEIARLVDADAAALLRFEADDTVTLLAAWQAAGEAELPIGARRPLDDLLRSVRDEGRPLRIGPTELPGSGAFAEELRRLGTQRLTAVAVPVMVEGRVWGVAVAASEGERPFAEDTETRIAGFTELVGTAIANAQARAALRRLLDEQRALRSVATRVARGASPEAIFDDASRQASRLRGVESVVLLRCDADGSGIVVAACGAAADVVGERVAPGAGVAAVVVRTARSARIDDYDRFDGPTPPVARATSTKASVGAPIIVGGEVWGLMLTLSRVEPLPPETEGRLTQLAELVATAIGNAASRRELTASRARVVAAADESRRRIQRDLHDGAQQRLVHTAITLRLARAALRESGVTSGTVVELLGEALENAGRATAELRDLVHGIMPAALSCGGLRPGVRSLTSQMDLPVTVDVIRERLATEVETTAYFVIAEALTNTVKHAGASGATVRAVVRGDALEIEVRDDGGGGADRTRGTGLVGLIDRVAVRGGTISITSPAGAGTVIAARLPLTEATADVAAPAGAAPWGAVQPAPA